MLQSWARVYFMTLCNVPLVFKHAESTITGRSTETTTQVLEKHKIIPDIILKAPPMGIEISYIHKVVDFGTLLDTLSILHAPTHVSWMAEPETFYTLVVTGPDVPTRDNHSMTEFQHWIVGNIPENAVFAGETLTEYEGSGLAYGPGLHRLVFLVYKQPDGKKIKFNEEILKTSAKPVLRCYFSNRKFSEKYNLKDPVAVNFLRIDELNG